MSTDFASLALGQPDGRRQNPQVQVNVFLCILTRTPDHQARHQYLRWIPSRTFSRYRQNPPSSPFLLAGPVTSDDCRESETVPHALGADGCRRVLPLLVPVDLVTSLDELRVVDGLLLVVLVPVEGPVGVGAGSMQKKKKNQVSKNTTRYRQEEQDGSRSMKGKKKKKRTYPTPV